MSWGIHAGQSNNKQQKKSSTINASFATQLWNAAQIMRKVTRLIGKRGPRKAQTDATGYNAFVRPQQTQQSQAAAAIPSVHSKVIRKGAGSGLRVESNPTAAKIQYAAYNRIRNSGSSSATATPTMRHSSRHRWMRRCCCWRWRRRQRNRRRRSYKNYWRTDGKASKPKSGWWRRWCCWVSRHGGQNSYHYDSEDEDDDIDAKVAAYILEMKQRETDCSKQSEQIAETTLTDPSLSEKAEAVVEAGVQCSNSDTSARQEQQKPQQQRAWTWDDSLRSNSDRFLETLEEELPGAVAVAAVGEGRLRLSLTLRRTPLHVTFQEEVQGRRLPACLPVRLPAYPPCMRLSRCTMLRCTKPKIASLLSNESFI